MLKKIFHYSILLAFLCGLSVFGVSLVYSITYDAIQEKNQAKTQSALAIVLPNLQTSGKAEIFKFENKEYSIFIGQDKETQKVKGWAVQIGEQGYSSVIQTMVGIDTDNKVLAIEIVFQQETPGLGTQASSTGPKKLSSLWIDTKEEIKRPWFQTQFEKRSLDQMELKRDIQIISGATITSAAVNRSVQRAIQIIQAFRKEKD